MYLRLLDSDELVEGYSCVPPEKPVDPCDFLSLVFGISRPGNGDCGALAAYFYEVAGRYPELLHCRIIDADFTMSNISLFSVSYSDLYFFGHHYWFNSMVVVGRLSLGEDWRLVLRIAPDPILSSFYSTTIGFIVIISDVYLFQ
jgi:hypothetical protein